MPFTQHIVNVGRQIGLYPDAIPCLDVLPQHNHVSTDESEMGMDFIGHFETLAEDVSHVATRLGLRVSVPHLNPSPSRRPYPEYYDSVTAEMVGEVYRKDVEMFGYDFESNRLQQGQCSRRIEPRD